MTKLVEADESELIEQNLKIIRGELLNAARRRLSMVLDEGQRGEDYTSDRAVYAAAKAYCTIYEECAAQGQDGKS